MNKINMNGFGMPKSGVEVMQEKMFGGMRLENGPQLPELEMPEFGNVAEVPVRMGGMNKLVDTAQGVVGEDAERTWRMSGLQSLVLYDKDEYFRENVGKHPELGYLTPDRVRADKKGFNMLLGAELSQAIGNGDTYGALQVTINALPQEKQLGAKGRVQQCETEYQAHELLGELWSEVMVTGYAEKKAELEAEAAKKKERAEAALGEVNKWLDAGWVERVKSGVGGAPLSDWTKAEAVQSGAMTAEQVAELDETTARAQQAFELLMVTMHDGRTYVGHRLDVSHAAKARKKELAKDWSLVGDGEPISDEDIWQQTAHEMSSKYRLSRADIVKLLDCMRRPDGTIDETALALFAAACHDVAYGEQAILSSDFWGNFVGALGDWGIEAVDYFDRSFTQAKSLTSPTNYKEAHKRLDTEYSADVEKMKGMFAEVEAIRRSPDERMPWVKATWTETGEVVGSSAPFLIASAINPALGYATLYPSTTNAQIASNYYHGVANPVAMAHITGTWQTLAEGLFGKAVMKIPGASKLMDWVGLKTVSVPLIGKAVGKVQGNAFLRIATGMGMETAGELVVEDLVASIGEWGTVKLVNALGGDLPEQELNLLDNAWKNMQDSSQTGATAAYCVALGMLGVPANMQAARDFASSREFLLQAGLTEGGVAEVQAAHAEYSVSVAKALELERFRLSKVRAEAGDKAVEEAENKAGRPLEGVQANKIRTEAGEKAVAEEVEKIKVAHQGKLNETMRRVYDRDVLREDPVALKKRMEKRGEKFLEDVEVGLYAASGVRDAVLAEAGVTVGEKSEKGLRKVRFEGEKEGEVKEVEWTDEQLNAYVAMQREGGMAKRMRYFQTLVAGTALAEAEVTDASVKHELVNMRALPARALARMQRNGGKVDYAVMQDLAEDAAEKINGFVAGGMSAGEARAQMSELPGVTLGTLAQSANAFVQRVEELVGTAEGRALGINNVTDAVTNVFRMNRANAPGQSVIMYNKGLASEREVVEDLLESDVVAAVEGEHASTSWEALEGMLRRVEGELMQHGGGRLFKSKEKASQMAIIEAFSKLGQSYFLLNHGKYQMSAEAHGTIEYVQKKMADAQHLVAMSHAWEAFAKSKEGKAFLKKEGASFEKLLSDAGASVAGHYAAAKFDAAAFAAVREAYEGSIVPSLEAAKPVLEQYEAEQKALDRPAAEDEGLVVPADESVTGEELKLEPEAVVDDSTGDFVPPPGAEVESDVADKGRGLVGGNYVPMEDGSVYGVALVEDVQLSADVPQFKKKESAAGRVEADADGTTHELAGGWNANSAPIHVWRRVDGRLEVISGRHRLAHAKKNGVKHIAVRVYDEAAGYDAKWAKLHDVEQNILDNTCNAIDVAYYFRHNPMPLGEAEARGLMPKTKQGEQTAASRMGLHVAAHASDDTFAMLVNGGCTAEDAYMACLVAASAEGQQLALEARAGKKGKKNSWEYVTALVRGAEQLAPADGGGMLDLFGNDESFRESSEKMARYVAAVRAGLKARLNVLQSAGRLNKKESVSKELGVKVKAPKDALRLIERIAMLDAAYERLDYELGIPAKVEAWDGKSAVPTKLDELEAKGTGVSYSLASAEMEAIKAAAVADGTFMKAPNGKTSNLNERQWLQVRTTAFKDWFGDWEKVALFNAAIEKLSSMNEVATISGNEFAPDGRKLTDKVTEFWNKEYGGIAKNPLLGDVTLDTRSVKASIAHGVGRLKSAAFAVVHDVIEQGVLVEIAPNWKGRGEDSYVIVAPVQIGDEAYVCEVVVMKGERRTGFYLHEVQIKEKLLDVFKTGVVTGTSGASRSILLDVWQRVKQIEENCSKVVDENGEPLVVYHGSLQWFQIFNDGNERHQSGAPDGTIFANDNREIAVSFVDYYGGNAENVILNANDARHARMPWGVYRKGGIYPLFMNLKNPLVVDFEGMTWHGEKYDIKDVNWYAVEARKKGHDGLIVRNVIDVGFTDTNDVPPSTDYVAFESNQVKSVTDNRGTFDGSNPDITFSMAHNLAAVHSLSAEKFLGALELGGMPLPSVAVTRLDKPYSWGSEKHIYLVGRPELVDPKRGTEVFSADAWTGYVPRLVHKKAGKEDRSAASVDLYDIKNKYQDKKDGDNTLNSLDFKISEGEKTELYEMNEKLRSASGKVLFAWQSGYRPRPKMKDAVRTHEWLTREFAKELLEYTQLPREEYEKRMPEMDAAIKREVVQYYANKNIVKNAPSQEMRERRLNSWASSAMRAFWRDTPILLKQELGDVANIGKRVLDTQANLKMLEKYADKHKRAFETWVEEKLNKWYSKERYIDGTKKEATLDNITAYMLREKGRNKENDKFIGYGQVRALRAREMSSLEDIKEQREKLVDSKTSEEQKSKTNEQMYNWQYYAGQILNRNKTWHDTDVLDDLMRVLADVKGKPTAEKLRVAVNHMFRRETRSKVQELLNNEKVIGYGVEALKSLRAELEDYMEAVPQRAVQMNEWEYAVMPESLKKNKSVMAGLREHGIRPRFHDGTEEGRKAALAGLVGDSKVSFSVIGPKAETWEWYQDVAFKGRDDGMLRAEIDASGARLKTLTGAAAYEYRREVENVPDFWRKRYARWLELDALFDTVYYSDEEPTEEQRAEAAAAEEEYYMLTEEVKDMMEALIERGGAWKRYAQLEAADKHALRMEMVRSIVDGKVDEAVYEKLGALSAGDGSYRLGDVLDFAELYGAYPQLTSVYVRFVDLPRGALGQVDGWGDISVVPRLLEDAEQLRSVLLHEVQHAVQRIEGFAKGGNSDGVYRQMKEELEFNEWEMKQLARELRWFSALDYAKDYLKSARRLLRYPNAWKYNGLRYRYWKASLGNEDMTRLLVDDIAGRYEEMRKEDEQETLSRGFAHRAKEYVLPEVDFSSLAGVERGLAVLEGLTSRRGTFRGEAPKKDKKYLELMKYTNAAKRMLDKYELEPYELYRRLAGEIEARNVQERRDWTMDERLSRPFNETLEYPGEALVTFSMASVTAEWEDTLERFRVMQPKAGTPAYRQDIHVCPTPAVMQMVGAKGWDIVMSPDIMVKCLHKDTILGNGQKLMDYYAGQTHRHDIDLEVMKQLPAAMADPICIVESDTPDCIEVVTELKESGKNILVAVQLNAVKSGTRNQQVNRIASLYGKEQINRLLGHQRLYWNKAKARFWTGGKGLQSPVAPYPKRASARRVLKPDDLVKYKMQTGLSFSLTGRGMIDAAPLGKMSGEAKMQRLLNYARKEAGRWTRTFGKDTPNARAAEAMGTVSSILASIYKELPPRFRPRVEGHMRYVEVYARLLESGKVRSYGRLSKEQRAAVEAELLEVLQDAKAKADAEYELAKKEALDAAELTGEMAAMEAAEEMDVDDEVKRAAYLDRLAKRTMNETRKRLLAETEVKKQQLEADIEVLKRDFAAEKLAQIASRMLNDAADAVEAYLIDEELGAVDVLMERLAPRKLPNGKYDKGRMSADAYRKFVSYVELMNKSKGEVDEKLVELGLQIAAEEAKSEEERMDDGAKLDALTEELAAWSTYGGLRGKNLEGVRKGVAALGEFAAYEKNAWSSMLKLQRNRAKRQALVAAQGLGGADEFKVKEETEKQAKLLQRLKDLGAGLQSIGQIFYGLGGVPEMRALVDESLDALSAGHVALASREKRAFGQLAEYMEAAMGLKTERQRNNWMAALKKKHKTNIYREGELVRHRLRLTLAEAAEWLELSKAERDAKRAEMDAAADKQGVLAENVPYEEDIPLMREELRRIQEEESSAKYVRTVREFRKDAPKEPMVLSKDEALNILLLCEQADYVDAAHENGYTDEVLAKLAEFVGNEVLGFGYAMREVLENNGLAEVYEAREGVPFPKVNNYWPGHFDQSARVNEQANALDPTSGGGTRYGMLITRVKHKLKFNLMGASNVFMAALAQQNNYICMGELTAKWRRLLSHNDFAMAMKAHLGVAQFKQFKELIELLDGAGVQESITQQTLSGLLGQFQSAHAMAVLAGSPITLVKQLSAMLNAGAWEGISCSRVLARIVLDRFGGGAIKYGDMLQKDYFQARYRDKRYFTEMMQLGRDANWSMLSAWARGGMRWIEKMDVLTNCASMTALYNITYHDLKKRNEGAADAMTEEEMHAECDRVVRNTLELGAQPLRRTQKSAFAALSRNALVKATCYMGSEALNKLGMTLSMKRRTGGGAKGFLKAWKYLAGVSIAQQVIVMLLDMARNADPVDEDEWAEWLLLNLATGASGLGLLQSVPVLGEAVQKLTGGYVKTGSLGQMIYDFEGMWRSGKKVVTMAADEKDDSWADWAWAGADLGRRLTFLTGAWGGINSSSKGASELAGLLQSLNAMANTVRPVVQAERNDEKRMKAYRKKVEKEYAAARKRRNEELKVQREQEKVAKEKEKKREALLKRL